jgi:hypothetical protein
VALLIIIIFGNFYKEVFTLSVTGPLTKFCLPKLLILIVTFCLLLLLQKAVFAGEFAFQIDGDGSTIQDTFESQAAKWHFCFSPYLDLQPKDNPVLGIGQAYADW